MELLLRRTPCMMRTKPAGEAGGEHVEIRRTRHDDWESVCVPLGQRRSCHKVRSRSDRELLRCYGLRVENGHTVPAIDTLESGHALWEFQCTSYFTKAKRRRRYQRTSGTWECHPDERGRACWPIVISPRCNNVLPNWTKTTEL